MDTEGPDEIDPEIGVFGDPGSQIDPIERRDPARIKQAEYWRKKRERDDKVSSDFNSHMIYLFNQK